MNYSDIVGEAYYHIGLTKRQKQLVDVHFYAAAHHRWRMYAAEAGRNSSDLFFHRERYLKHLERLLETVAGGDFSRALDRSGRGLNAPVGWSMMRFSCIDQDNFRAFDMCLPDSEMFDLMDPDYRFYQGEPHGYDAFLEKTDAFVILQPAAA